MGGYSVNSGMYATEVVGALWNKKDTVLVKSDHNMKVGIGPLGICKSLSQY